MPDRLTLIVAIVFVLSVAVVIGLGLAVIAVVLRVQAKYRRRLRRVGRKRLSGNIDIEDMRLSLVKNERKESNATVAVSEALGRFIPLLNTTRLKANFQRAALPLSVGAFIMISLVVSALIAVAGTLATDYPAPAVVLPSLFLGMLLVDKVVTIRGSMLTNRFMKQLPDALDTIIRGVRSGLPVVECINTVGEEYPDPVGPHFQAIGERVHLGEPLEQALWRVAKVIKRPEMDFLAIAIAIQMETGGSLAEALGNLADLLRNRQRMKLKIKAISSEAKASAMIIGALPFVMLLLLTIMSPGYTSPLFTDPRGQTMLLIGLGSITMGAIVMWRMTQFEI
jgi:tight adherence protein B